MRVFCECVLKEKSLFTPVDSIDIFCLNIQPKSLKLRWYITPDDGKHSFLTAGPRAREGGIVRGKYQEVFSVRTT